MYNSPKHVCPVEMARSLDNIFRIWFQNPRKILAPFIREGMTVLDIGCGPGFFSTEIAEMVGPSGRVIACDLQKEMLEIVARKIRGTALEKRIMLHQCPKDATGVLEPVDFVLAFYMLHELPDQERFFDEISSIVKTGGQVFIAEPLFHVPANEFEQTVKTAQAAGFTPAERPYVFFSKAVILKKT